jgi:hypothetical protein
VKHRDHQVYLPRCAAARKDGERCRRYACYGELCEQHSICGAAPAPTEADQVSDEQRARAARVAAG